MWDGRVESDRKNTPCEVPVRCGSMSAAPPERVSRRVLVIDDNTEVAASLRDVFEFHDHLVEVAHSGPEGLEKAREFRPDVVFCDIGLPGMDGYEVAKMLRADDRPKGVATLVALTAYSLPQYVAKAYEAGFDLHLAKPPSIDVLEKIVASGSVSR